jgi:hypothetical protein
MGMIMGRAMVATRPLTTTAHWSPTTRLTPGLNGATNNNASSKRSRQRMWGPYAPSYPSARSSRFRATFDDPQTESQASPALERIEAIMERHEAAAASASMASLGQFTAFLSQGKFHSSY